MQLHITVAGNFYALFAKKSKINLLNKILHVQKTLNMLWNNNLQTQHKPLKPP